MSSTTPTTLSKPGIAAGATKALKAVADALPPQAVEAAKDLARKSATEIAAKAQHVVREAGDTVINLATDAIIGPLHRILQGIKIMPGADTLMLHVGALLADAAANFIPTSQKVTIPKTIFKDICYEPEKVSGDVAKQLEALRNHPRIKGFLDTLSSPQEFITKLFSSPGEIITKIQEILGFNQAAAPAKPAPKPEKTEKTEKADKPGWVRRLWNWFGKFAGPTEAKEIAEAKKNATGIKAMWLKLPPIVRKGAFYGGGILLALKAVTLGWFVVKAGIALFVGSKVLNGAKGLLGGGKSEDKPKGRSLFNPFSWFRSSKKTSPAEEADQAVAQSSGGWKDKLGKAVQHATKLAGHAQNLQTNPLGTIAGLLGGGGAPQNT